MNIGVVTLYTPEIAELGNLTADNHRQYCSRHRYTYVCYHKSLWWERPAPYSKLVAISQQIKNFDWLFWMDTDAVFVHFDQPLEKMIDERYHVIIGNDPYGLNTGAFFIRNSAPALDFLGAVTRYPHWNPGCCWEQDSFKSVLEKHPSYRAIVNMVGDDLNTFWTYNHPKLLVHTYGEPGQFRVRCLKALMKRYAKNQNTDKPSA